MNSRDLPALTKGQKDVFDFVHRFLKDKGIAPTLQEIATHFKLRSHNSAAQYLEALEEKGYILRDGGNKKRALYLARRAERAIEIALGERRSGVLERRSARGAEEVFTLPLCGRVAAGKPLDVVPQDDTFDVPRHMIQRRPDDHFVLHVKGDSMVDDGILDGDYLIIRKQDRAESGQTVVALVDNEATVKRYFFRKGRVELHPANPSFQPIIVDPHQSFKIEGILAGVIRKFN
jgi:repressor LexA